MPTLVHNMDLLILHVLQAAIFGSLCNHVIVFVYITFKVQSSFIQELSFYHGLFCKLSLPLLL